MPRQRFTLTRRLARQSLIPALALALLVASLLVIGNVFTDVPASAAVSPGVTVRASVTDNETQGDRDSRNPSISADGRYVAFESWYPFDPLDRENDGSRPELDVYVRDTVAGTTTLISHGREALPEVIKSVQPDGAVRAAALTPRQPADGASYTPSISADGRYVTFTTDATNIPYGGWGNQPRLVVCDRDTNGDGTLDGECVDTVLSGSGVFRSGGTMTANATLAVYESEVTRSSWGTLPSLVLVRLGRTSTGVIPYPSAPDFTDVTPPMQDPDGHRIKSISSYALSADGSHIGLSTTYGTPSASWHLVYDYDVAAGTFLQMDVNAAGVPLDEQGRYGVALSGDGRRFAFVEDSAAGQFIRLYDRDPDADGVLWSRGNGEPLTTEIGSRNTAGAQVHGIQPAFSTDGRYFAFVTDAVNVHNGVDDPGSPNLCFNAGGSYPVEGSAPPSSPSAAVSGQATSRRAICDVVVRDLVVDRQRETAAQPRLAAELASPSRLQNCRAFKPGATCEGGNDSERPALTANGSAVAYASWADDLVSEDTNRRSDVFVRRFTPTLTAAPVDFGTVELEESATRVVPLRHAGFGPLTVGPVAIDGPNAGDFAVFPGLDCKNVILHGTEQCAVTLRFRPSAAGARTAVLHVTVVGASNPVEIRLTGTGKEPPPGFRATPNPVAFGERGVLMPSAAQTITVANTGRGPLRLSQVTLAGAAPTGFPGDYEITANTCLAAPVSVGGSCQVSVRHVPKAVGVRPAAMRFVEAGDSQSVHLIDLTGAGLAPTIAVKPPLAPPGQVVQVTGANFPPGSTVRLALDSMPGEVRAVVAADGTLNTQFPILPHTTNGKRPLRATVVAPLPAGLAGPVQASTDFLVVPGSLQPPDFTVRK